MDVKSAFINVGLAKEVYMTQPEGFFFRGGDRFVCKLKKSIYLNVQIKYIDLVNKRPPITGI